MARTTAAQARYNASPKGKARKARYESSPAGLAARRAVYWRRRQLEIARAFAEGRALAAAARAAAAAAPQQGGLR
jgi:hypothetical protein